MAPEQAMGADADSRSDLYAFGIMIYQMLLGQTPFRADTPQATLMAHIHQPLPLPTALDPDIDPKLEATLLKALAKDPNDRFQSARKMINALALSASIAVEVVSAAVAGDVAVKEPDVEAEAGPAPTPSRNWLLIGGGGGAVAIVAVVAALVVFSGGGASGEADNGQGAGSSTPATASGEGETTGGTAPVGAAIATPVPTETPTPEPSPTVEPTATPEPTPAISFAEALALLEDLTERAEQNVIGLRAVDTQPTVEVDFRTREQLESIMKGFFKREPTRTQVFEAQELYKALDLLDKDVELEDILLEIQLQQVYALFDPDSEQVYVSDTTSLGPFDPHFPDQPRGCVVIR